MVEGLLLMFLLFSYLFILGEASRNISKKSLPSGSRNISYKSLPSSRSRNNGSHTLPRTPLRKITVENNCDYTVWPGISNSNSTLSTTGFVLKKGEKRVIDAPTSWEGRLWGRSHCSTSSTGGFSCATGHCESGKIECAGANETAPVTVVQFSFKKYLGQDFYDVDLFQGYNLPLLVVPQSFPTCRSAGCMLNLTKTCLSDLKVVGEQPVGCEPTFNADIFKTECPQVYIYNDGDANSSNLLLCSDPFGYVITFCPSTIPPSTMAEPPLPAQTENAIIEPPLPAQTENATIEPPSETPFVARSIRVKQKSSWKLKLILGVLAALTIMIIITFVVVLRAKKAKKSDWNSKNVEAAVLLKRYSYAKVKKMTNSFAHVLGKGGFGIVYRGKLQDGGRDVAVKILKETDGNGEEFINEVASLSRTSHVNIVSLLGFCYEGNKRAIIYEFMPNGSLDKYISENMSMKMEWERLYEIALGVSRGLEYLHNRCVSRIVHFDIKPQNILMDKDLCPKISDFGLAKLCKNKESIMSMLDARGTAGYIAPEVFSKNFGAVSHKSDVYSYGMVILEMIAVRNRENIETFRSSNSSTYFPDWIYKDFDRRINMRIFGDQITEEEEQIAKKMALIGLWCIQTNPSDRPSMIKVIEMLEGNLEALQVPPKPLWSLPATTGQETVEDSNEISSFSTPSQFERETIFGDSVGL